MTNARTHTVFRAFFLLIPFLLFGTGYGQTVPAATSAQPTATVPAETSAIQIFSMEFRHPVADGALVRIICQIDAPVKNALPAEEIAAKGLDPNSFITCLGEFVGKEFSDGRHLDIRERYTPWTPEIETSLHDVIAAHNLTAENDYGARAETVTNPAYNILIAYADGRSLHITAAGETVNGHEADIEDILLTWCDETFAAKGK